jgi:Putative transposase
MAGGPRRWRASTAGLFYLLRPALSTQRLSYNAGEDWVRYRPKKGPPGDPEVFQWKPLDFLERFAKLIPPARLHLVRYHGALAPRSPLRPTLTRAAREGLAYEELLAGVPAGAVGATLAAIGKAAREAVSAAARSWAACLRRVFEVEPLICPACSEEMVLVAAINDDGELRRLMAHLNLPIELPKTLAARSPPGFLDEDSRIDPVADAWDARDPLPADD